MGLDVFAYFSFILAIVSSNAYSEIRRHCLRRNGLCDELSIVNLAPVKAKPFAVNPVVENVPEKN